MIWLKLINYLSKVNGWVFLFNKLYFNLFIKTIKILWKSLGNVSPKWCKMRLIHGRAYIRVGLYSEVYAISVTLIGGQKVLLEGNVLPSGNVDNQTRLLQPKPRPSIFNISVISHKKTATKAIWGRGGGMAKVRNTLLSFLMWRHT